jgi:hypothetical protein
MLGAAVRVFDRAPGDLPPGTQLWRGGVTDRASRGISTAHGPHWLTVAEFPAGAEAPACPAGPAPLKDWRLRQIVPGDRPSPETAGGVVLVAMSVAPAVEDEFNDWYTTEHIPLLSRVPGMISARRFKSEAGPTGYLALYYVTDIAIYGLPEWTSANETPWILRMRRFQTDRTYFIFSNREA